MHFNIPFFFKNDKKNRYANTHFVKRKWKQMNKQQFVGRVYSLISPTNYEQVLNVLNMFSLAGSKYTSMFPGLLHSKAVSSPTDLSH